MLRRSRMHGQHGDLEFVNINTERFQFGVSNMGRVATYCCDQWTSSHGQPSLLGCQERLWDLPKPFGQGW